MADEEKLKALEERLDAMEKNIKKALAALIEFGNDDYHAQDSKHSKKLNMELRKIR